MAQDAFHHEAFFYGDREEFLAGTAGFVREGLAAGAAALVVLDAPKLDLLRAELGADADAVEFADMAVVGHNPARIIPAWRTFVDHHADAPAVYGIGEPINALRGRDEMVECHRHEALLNYAFGDAAGFRLLCPYDTVSLAPEVVAHARHTHPVLSATAGRRQSVDYCGSDALPGVFCDPLPDPPAGAAAIDFDADGLGALRELVAGEAQRAGFAGRQGEDFLVAANEIATNSVRHGGGGGRLVVWSQDETLLCEVRDAGAIADPLVGRRRPAPGQSGGYGVWIANQVCDLVQVRTSESGSVVRLHMRRR